MPRYQQLLPLRRIEGSLERRRRPNPVGPPKRDPRRHGDNLADALDAVVAAHRDRRAIDGVDPALILRVSTAGAIPEEAWEKLGFTVLASGPDKTLILFTDDAEMQVFRERMRAYQQPPPPGQKHPRFNGFYGMIEEIGEVTPIDRIGVGLQRDGFQSPEDFGIDESYLVDALLWQPPSGLEDVFAGRVVGAAREAGGASVNEYRGASVTIVRVEGSGAMVRALLELPEIASINAVPVPDYPHLDGSQVTIATLPPVTPPPFGATPVGVIDSGLSSGHPMFAGVVAGTFGEPEDIGDDDEKGHGTSVASILAFGDVRERLRVGEIQAPFRLASAKVVDATGNFPREQIASRSIEAAIRRLHELGCRVVNISLSDRTRLVSDKASDWASTLDDLARELDLVVVVPTGNADKGWLAKQYGDGIVAAYPDYLLEPENRLYEPGSAALAVTVGSIAHGNGLEDDDRDFAGVQRITALGYPSPFTRTGPGIGGIIKPDFVDYGGTAVYDGPTQRLADGSQRDRAGILSANARYVQRLLRSGSGTSFAAPLVAYKAGLVRSAYPQASANLTRALLALSADPPPGALDCLGDEDLDRILRVLGYGLIDVERVLGSDDDRVLLAAEDVLAPDHFAVFEVPVVEAFALTPGLRHIRVALAFDPPVRNARLDYMGVNMDFHLVRGATAEDVFAHFRSWKGREGEPFTLPDRMKAQLTPNQQRRDAGTLQCATFTAKQSLASYGDNWFVVVRCLGGWAASSLASQRFAVVVEMRQQGQLQLFARIAERLRIRV